MNRIHFKILKIILLVLKYIFSKNKKTKYFFLSLNRIDLFFKIVHISIIIMVN